MDLVGTYAGLVEDNRDPEKLGRLKVRVPHVYGAVGGIFGAISTDNIPWAMPTGLPSGLSHPSGGMDWLPTLGDQVLVRFLDGEPEKPIWEWFMQTQESALTFKLHSYSPLTNKPNRGALTRYGHTIEWNEDGILATTSKGYRILLTDASTPLGLDGDIMIATQAGQSLEFDDLLNTVTLNVNQDYYINVAEQMLAMCGDIRMEAGSTIELDSVTDTTLVAGGDLSLDVGFNWDVKVGGNTTMDLTGALDITMAGLLALKVAETANISITGKTDLFLGGELSAAIIGPTSIGVTDNLTIGSTGSFTLNYLKLFLTAGASQPFVLGTQLQTFLEVLLVYLALHQHTSSVPGSPTSPPITPAPVLTNILSATTFGT